MLSIAGCSWMAPRVARPAAIEVPAAWSVTDVFAINGTQSLAQWWLHFDDPLLAGLITQALATNTSVRSARAALRQSRALRDVAAAALYPGVNGSASAGRTSVGNNDAVNSFKVGLDASWELDVFGANRSALRAADATARASAASLGDVQVSIAAEVALNYIALRGTQLRLTIAETNLASQLDTLQITNWRMQAGLVTSLETEQSRAATEQTRAQLPALQTSIEQTRHALAVLTGRPPAALAQMLAATGPIPQTAFDLALSFPAETLRQRPDVRNAEWLIAAAMARVAQANAARLPDFRLGGSLGLAAMTLDALTSGASIVRALLASMTVPLFDGGGLRAQVRVQQAALDIAGIAYEAAVLTALTDVEDALVALRNDRQRLTSLSNAADAAAIASLLARQRFASGLVDFQVVLDTQRTQLSTQDSVATSNADVAADHVRLYKALGGGWRTDGNDVAVAPYATSRDDLPGNSRP
jgi:NodT family efflux transporter outer membrane factor (OMF) lipoprotein